MFGTRLSQLVLVGSAFACSTPSATQPDANPDSFDRSALLTHLATNVLLPMQADADAKAAVLPAAIEAYCNALDSGTVGTTADAAKAAWANAFDAWQRAESVLVGPAAMDNRALRERIYAWPLLATCAVDRDTASRWADPSSYDIATKPVNAIGLGSIEYLLFTPSTMHNCAIAPTGWEALGADLPKARCRLAHAIAVDAAATIAQVHTAWRADGGNYVGELANAGRAESSIASAQQGANLVSDGMFYLDKMVKDMKLAEAAGIAMNACNTVQEPCIREVEAQYADRTTFAIRANLAAIREVFTGETATGDGPGFDDFMIGLEASDVAARMTAQLDTAIAKANALPDSFLGALASQYSAVVDTHVAVDTFTDDLKSQFLTVLALEIPDDVAADND